MVDVPVTRTVVKRSCLYRGTNVTDAGSVRSEVSLVSLSLESVR